MAAELLLHVPPDFERHHEFRLLVSALKGRVPADKPVLPKQIESTAVFIFMRLWVELANLARSTNRPGYLTADANPFFEESLEPLFGDEEDSRPSKLLVDSKLLEPREGGEFFCPRFAALNPHFSGDYVRRESKGNALSQLTRQKPHIVRAANAQAMLLPAELFKTRNGMTMTDSEVQRTMVLIKTLDSCLSSKAARTRAQYTEGLMADAWQVAFKYADHEDDLRNIFAWIINHRDHPRLPKTAEAILSDFTTLEEMAE